MFYLPAYSHIVRGRSGLGRDGFTGSTGPRREAGLVGDKGLGALAPLGPAPRSGSSPNAPVERVRTEFPETWIWLNALVGYYMSCLFLLFLTKQRNLLLSFASAKIGLWYYIVNINSWLLSSMLNAVGRKIMIMRSLCNYSDFQCQT